MDRCADESREKLIVPDLSNSTLTKWIPSDSLFNISEAASYIWLVSNNRLLFFPKNKIHRPEIKPTTRSNKLRNQKGSKCLGVYKFLLSLAAWGKLLILL